MPCLQGVRDKAADESDPDSKTVSKGLLFKTEGRLLIALQGLQAAEVLPASGKDRRLVQFAKGQGREHKG